MEALTRLAKRLKNLDINEILYEIYQKKEFQDLTIDQNLVEQLFKYGIDSKGNSLGQYAPSTIKAKKRKGQPYDRITLIDTGAFYESYEFAPLKDGFMLSMDGKKENGDLFRRYGKDVLGLNDESIDVISKMVIDGIIEYIKKEVAGVLD